MVGTRVGIKSRVRSPSRLAWAAATVAPWCAALAFVISFPADAGQEPQAQISREFRLAAAPTPDDLVPADPAAGPFGFRLPSGDAVVRSASLMVGDPSDFPLDSDEIEPRIVLKVPGAALPAVDRSHRSDPTVGLRPTFDARLRRGGSLALARQAMLAFEDEDPAKQPTGFDPAMTAAPGPTVASTFQPVPGGATLTTGPTASASSPRQTGGATTPRQGDGSTPGVSRAASLGSSTPAASDSLPIEIGALPKFSRGPHGIVTGNTTVVGIEPAHPDYAALIDAAKAASEQKCLATAIYFEARSEPEEGQAAVAQVILNRVSSGLYPSTVCGVVFQNQQRHNACQFSFACEGRALRITDPGPWARAVQVAREVTAGTAYVSDVGSATHYHANYVRPLWASRLTKMDRIGHHIFYKLKPGQI